MSRNYRCVTATSLAEIESHRAAWLDLMLRAVEDNFYLSPAFMLATLRHHALESYLVVFVYRADAGGERLVTVAPFSCNRPTLKIPFTVLSGFASPHGYLSHPLLDRDDADDALEALWEWIEQPTQPWQMIFFQGVSEASPFLPRLKSLLEKRGRRFLSKRMFMRPMLGRYESFDAYLASLSPTRRKNYRRRWKQLMNDGTVDVVLHRNLDQAGDLAERFLQLEQRSWKGLHGTAMACEPEDTGFFREMVENGGRTGNLFFVELKFNGKLIAMTSNFIVGQTLFAFKIAYDPEYQEYSPGILVEIETVKLFQATPELLRGEGGATGESYLRSYWRDLVEMRALYIAMPGLLPHGYLSLLSSLWRGKRIFRQVTHGAPQLVCLKLNAVTPGPVSTGNEILLATCQLL
jgi:CelD/BcsL family acetyltransferase involved in cellulose biosynthesis